MPKGKVSKIEAEYAIVNIERQEMCGDCHACDMVHTPKKCTLKCINSCEAVLGDTVEVSLDQETFLKATYIMYGIPFVGLMIGLLAGYRVSIHLVDDYYKELFMVAGALIGMLVAFLIVKMRDKKKKYQKMLPHIVSRQENSY